MKRGYDEVAATDTQQTSSSSESPLQPSASPADSPHLKRQLQRYREYLERRRQEAEALRQQEHEKLLKSTPMQEQPFLFLADELVLRIFGFLAANDLAQSSTVSRRFYQISLEEKLWKQLCEQTWGTLPEPRLFYRNNAVSWRVTFRNNRLAEIRERIERQSVAKLQNPIVCEYCHAKAATRETHQRNCVYYITWFKCLECGKCWNWGYSSAEL